MITILGYIFFGKKKEYEKCKKEISELKDLLERYRESIMILQQNNKEYKQEIEYLSNFDKTDEDYNSDVDELEIFLNNMKYKQYKKKLLAEKARKDEIKRLDSYIPSYI